ncbi:MAG: TolC family protein [Holosporales bacterium]|jgi:outer membrane protein|nr:TolC family protein [Holosporales bacterium]
MFCRKFLLLAAACILHAPAKTVAPVKAADGASALNSESKRNNKPNTKTPNKNLGMLGEALTKTIENNKELLAAQREIYAANESCVAAFAHFLPTIETHAGLNKNNYDNWSGKPPEGQEGGRNKSNSKSIEKNYGIAAKINLFHAGADRAALKEVDLQNRARWSKYEATKQKVLREVAAYYFEIYAKMQEIQHLKALLKLRESSLEVAQEMFNTGAAKYLDVAQASAGYAEVEAKLAKANAENESLRAKFTELTGFVLPVTLEAPKQLFDDNMTQKQATDLALKFNPNIIASADNLAATKEAAKKPFGKALPSIDAQFGFNQSVNQDKTRTPPEHEVKRTGNRRGFVCGISATWALYDGGVGRAEKRQADELVLKAVIESEKTKEEVLTEISSVLASLKAAHQNRKSADTAVQARKLALDVTEQEFKAGLKIMNDVIKAQEEYSAAVLMAIQAEKEWHVSLCSLMALVGRLNNKQLGINPADTFDYKAHYKQVTGRFF